MDFILDPFFSLFVFLFGHNTRLTLFPLSKPVDRHHFFKGKHSTINIIIQCLPFLPSPFNTIFQSRTVRHNALCRSVKVSFTFIYFKYMPLFYFLGLMSYLSLLIDIINSQSGLLSKHSTDLYYGGGGG